MKDIYNFLPYHDKLSNSGMPTSDQMTSVAEAGVDVVINLAPHDVPNAIPDEPELVKSLGMDYINIPVNWGTPTRDGLNVHGCIGCQQGPENPRALRGQFQGERVHRHAYQIEASLEVSQALNSESVTERISGVLGFLANSREGPLHRAIV